MFLRSCQISRTNLVQSGLKCALFGQAQGEHKHAKFHN